VLFRSLNLIFGPLGKRIPVYPKPFTLVQEVILAGTQEAQATFAEQRI